jgi:hypothetical protein
MNADSRETAATQATNTVGANRRRDLLAVGLLAAVIAVTASGCVSATSGGSPGSTATTASTASTSAEAPSTAATTKARDAGAGQWTLNTKIHSHCWSTNDHVDCDFTLSNDTESTVPFEWAAGSDPPGAVFSQTSGSIDPGQSQTVHGSADLGCHVLFGFVDQRHNSEEHEDWKANNNC